ncbi:MAG: T9SS type A sorting domain-containing protein [Bacteroidetes bacterium]|nr:T9SS type A sorting domain-containing protein [Bacteroidota bacterium]
MKTKTTHKASAIFATICLLFAGESPARADKVITSGTTFKVTAGTTVVSAENLVVKSGATLDNAGTLILKKGLTNEYATPNSIGSGTAEFSGTASQTISGQNIIQHLNTNNSAGVTIGGNTRVNGILTLTSGKEFPSGFTGTFSYPVGDDTGTPEYSPVTLTFSGGTFGSGNYAGVSLRNIVYPDPNITGNYLNRYWTISQSGITSFSCNASFQYVAADVSGTENKLSCTRVNPAPWVAYALTNAAAHQLTALGLGSFGSFTGVKTATPPANQELANITIPNGVSTCYDATQILTIAGSGNVFLVDNGGSVTLVAGSKVYMLAGAKVSSGGYLHGYITTNGTYCGAAFNPLVANTFLKEDELGVTPGVKNQFVKLYPNPTADIVIVELVGTDANTVASVTVYSMQGCQLLQKTMIGDAKLQFSLSGRPVGMYMVHVQSGERSEIAKVVKN